MIQSLAFCGALIVVCLVFAGVVRSRDREHARERHLLINQLFHAQGRPWQTAPADTERRERGEQEGRIPWSDLVHPSHLPDDLL